MGRDMNGQGGQVDDDLQPNRQAEASASPLPLPPASASPSASASASASPALNSELKRDSGIAPKDEHEHGSLSQSANPPPSLRESHSLPSIVVHDAPPSSSWSRKAPPFMRKKQKQGQGQGHGKEEGQEPQQQQEQEHEPSHSRLQSFHGIDMIIPTDTGFEDVNSPDKLKFSNRGSILLGTRKMQTILQAPRESVDDSDFHTAPSSPAYPLSAPTSPTSHTPRTSPAAPLSPPTSPNSNSHSLPASPSPNKKRLTSGPRTPSVHMLNAVLDGRRVLSAEEVTFSQKVRSMYEYGDERAADWTTPASHATAFDREDTPEPPEAPPAIANPRRRPQTSQSARASPASKRFSFIANEHECAGGIEDWQDLAGEDIDRYGFINPHKLTGSATPLPKRPSVQRVSTSLQLLSNSPRQRRGLIRGPSTARSARSLPPSRTSTAATVGSPTGPPASVYSFQSNHSSTRVHNPFRSRDRRALEEASDMLTLPACLNHLPETDVHESFLRRREWQREEKWRKMARLVSPGEKGGGMAFDFDVKDPKLIARTWKGVPDKWRATAWHAFLSASAKRRGDCKSDHELIETFHHLQDQSSADDVQIDVDVPRTISMHIMFRRRYRGGQRLLFRVLHAISIHFPDTGYVQGMAALAATLLCYYDEEHTFIMLVRLWELRGLRTLYEHGFEGLMKALKEFEDDWLGKDPDLKAKLDDFGIGGTSYGTRWYLTLFNLSIPFPAQLRVWDVFMLLGDVDFPGNPPFADRTAFDGADLSVLHATSAALMDATKVIINDSDFENAMKVLTSWIPIQDEDMLMRVAKAEWKMHMKNRRHTASS